MTKLRSFFVPEGNNAISRNDIEKGMLRITMLNKKWFPESDTTINIVFANSTKQVNFKKNGHRSDRLYVGKDFMEKLKITTESKLKFTQRSSNEFLIEEETAFFSELETKDISYEQLQKLKEKYWRALIDNPFPTPPKSGKAIEMISYFKRKLSGTIHLIGPYVNLSVFEAANRIASDLVIINGIEQLIRDRKEPFESVITVRLGNKHEITKGDFTINGKEGEAFNVASSFYKAKLGQTKRKWKAGGLDYIFINADVSEELHLRDDDPILVKVSNWDKP